MGGEQIVGALAAQRIDDEKRSGGRVAFGILVDDLLCAAGDLVESRCQPQRIAADLCTAPVGGIFAGAADCHLHDHGGKWRDNHGDQNADEAERIMVFTAAAAKKHREIAKHGNGAGKGGSDSHGQCIAVFDMGKFMRHDGGDFLG